MLEKEAELALTNNELAELEEYQVIVCYAVTQQLIATDAWKTSCNKYNKTIQFLSAHML